MNEKLDNGKSQTSWGKVAGWYDELLESDDGTYQSKIILPNLLRLLGDIKGREILDLACGQGFFSREFAVKGALVAGVDLSPELIAIAKKNSGRGASYFVGSADKVPFPDGHFDVVVSVLALQNIENLSGAVSEAARVLKSGGRLFAVLNHPAFRIPRRSSWGFDEREEIQYRRVDGYISESRVPIVMNPGKGSDKTTLSFHRPLQVYFKAFTKAGFVVTRLEEWVSDRKSQPGPRAVAENRARKEFPLFLFLEARKSK